MTTFIESLFRSKITRSKYHLTFFRYHEEVMLKHKPFLCGSILSYGKCILYSSMQGYAELLLNGIRMSVE